MNPVRVGAHVVVSQAAAARILGVSAWTVAYHLERGTIDRAGTGSRPSQCEWDGITYPSIAAAARAAGISREAMRQRIERAAKKSPKEART